MMPSFGAPFQNPVQTAGGVTPHWSTIGGTIADSHIAAWTPKGAASLAASYVRYGTLGSGLTVGVAPTLSNGWVFNGSQYLNAGVTPASDWSMFVQFANLTYVASSALAGEYDSGHNTGMLLQMSANHWTYWNGGSLAGSATVASGNVGVAGDTGYLNGSPDTSAMAAWSGTPCPIYIGGFDNSATGLAGSAIGKCTATIRAIAIIDLKLTGTQVAALAAAMAAL